MKEFVTDRPALQEMLKAKRKKNVKGNPLSRRKIIPDITINPYKGMKSIRQVSG